MQWYLTGDELVRQSSAASPFSVDTAPGTHGVQGGRTPSHTEVRLQSGETEARAADALSAESRNESPSMSRQLTRGAESGDSSAAEGERARGGRVDMPEARASKTPLALEARNALLAISSDRSPTPDAGVRPAAPAVRGASLAGRSASPLRSPGERASRSPGAVGSWCENEWELMEQLKLLELTTVKKKKKRAPDPGRREPEDEQESDAGATPALAMDPLVIHHIASEAGYIIIYMIYRLLAFTVTKDLL